MAFTCHALIPRWLDLASYCLSCIVNSWTDPAEILFRLSWWIDDLGHLFIIRMYFNIWFINQKLVDFDWSGLVFFNSNFFVQQLAFFILLIFRLFNILLFLFLLLNCFTYLLIKHLFLLDLDFLNLLLLNNMLVIDLFIDQFSTLF